VGHAWGKFWDTCLKVNNLAYTVSWWIYNEKGMNKTFCW
jgi:hypothetical protein